MRARNIKPGFFKNEILAEEGPCAQLLFAGLWGLADKAGILEDRPRRIKAEIFPYYDPKPGIDTLLKNLYQKGFIHRYKIGNLHLIQITNFQKHQSPHNTEKSSIYPPPLINSELTENNGYLTGDSPLDNALIPDSLIPDSLIPDSLIGKDISPPSKKIKKEKTPIPEDFGISEAVQAWAQKHGFGQLDEHLAAFKRKATMNGYVYLNWDMAFMEAIREDWAKIRKSGRGAPLPTSQGSIGGKYDGIGTTHDNPD